MQKSLSRYWLLLGVFSIAIAGLFSLVLVVARTPSLANLPYFADLFHKALVVHVDLSVLVWFLSIACLLWSMISEPGRKILPCVEEAALISFGLGMLALTGSVLDGKSEALMSNYIPVVTSPVFFMGLSLVFCGVVLMLVKLACAYRESIQFSVHVRMAISKGGWIAGIAAILFVASYKVMPREIEGQQYYELAFWAGGHVLQFLHVQVMLVCWLVLMAALVPGFALQRIVLLIIFAMGPACALVAPVGFMYPITSMKFREFYTQMMIVVNGIAPLMLVFYLVPALVKARGLRKGSSRALWSSLVMSIILFVYGGAIGSAIRGQNVVIPAHYHGSIVGVTLAFMGLAYCLLPKFGYRDVGNWRCAYWQPIVYGGGQLMHISGLAWSGGYGVLRKTPGGMEALPPDVKAAMGFMGLGGVIAIVGGFMFVIVVARAVCGRRAAPESTSIYG